MGYTVDCYYYYYHHCHYYNNSDNSKTLKEKKRNYQVYDCIGKLEYMKKSTLAKDKDVPCTKVSLCALLAINT